MKGPRKLEPVAWMDKLDISHRAAILPGLADEAKAGLAFLCLQDSGGRTIGRNGTNDMFGLGPGNLLQQPFAGGVEAKLSSLARGTASSMMMRRSMAFGLPSTMCRH